jgi:hypothetical protein
MEDPDKRMSIGVWADFCRMILSEPAIPLNWIISGC